MKKTVVSFGRSRHVEQHEEKKEYRSGALCGGLFALGVVAICASIVIPMSVSQTSGKDDAVAVMSDNVSEPEREILVSNDIPAEADEEFSIFEYIGEAVAYLLTGAK